MGKSSIKLRKAIEPAPTFQIDTIGDSSVRNSLHGAAATNPASGRLRKGTSFNKVLKSDQILAARSSIPALTSRAVPNALTVVKKDKEKMGRVDRATKDRLMRMTGRESSGIRSVKDGKREELLTEAMKSVGEYDAWEVTVERVVPGEDTSMKNIVAGHIKKVAPKAPTTLNSHPLLASAAGGPRAVPLPHPGSSYNPSHPHHQALLGKALTHYTAVEDREERGQPVKDAMDSARTAMKGLEPWEMYEKEVGSGEEESDAEVEDPEEREARERLRKKLPVRKTRQQRTKKVMIATEALALSLRRAAKARNHSVITAKTVTTDLEESITTSLAEKALASRLLKAKISAQGLTRLRSGPARVPDAPVTYQLGEELSDNLRTLTPEGNLWRDWNGSMMRRGRLPVERANESKKGGKRGGRGKDKGSKLKEVQKYAWKKFE